RSSSDWEFLTEARQSHSLRSNVPAHLLTARHRLLFPTDDLEFRVEADALRSQPSRTKQAVKKGRWRFNEQTFTPRPVGRAQSQLLELSPFDNTLSGHARAASIFQPLPIRPEPRGLLP